jgi:hypothetical protein
MRVGDPTTAGPSRARGGLARFRTALGVAGLVVLVLLVRHVGEEVILRTLRIALAWLPVLCLLELFLMASETAASYVAFGALAHRIPLSALFRAHVLGHSIAAVAPAPTVVRETIKATLLTPYVGVAPATSVAFISQAATLVSVGLFSIPCGAAILALGGVSIWFWACAVHAVILVACGVGLLVAARASGIQRLLMKRSPRLSCQAAAFREHTRGAGLVAAGPSSALFVGRCFQALQFGLASRAVGIDTTFLRAMAAQGVNLVASAVGVLVPAGIGMTEGAFALAANLLETSLARATALALLMRSMQLVWILIGSLVALAAPRRESR